MNRIGVHNLLEFYIGEGQKVWINDWEFLFKKNGDIFLINPNGEEKLNRHQIRGYLAVAVEHYRKSKGGPQGNIQPSEE